jgi:hypothetical protein
MSTGEDAALEGMGCFVEDGHAASGGVGENEFVGSGLEGKVARGGVEGEEGLGGMGEEGVLLG